MKAIAELAALIIRQLQAVTAKHIAILTDLSFTKDPIAEAEQLIQAMEAKQPPKSVGYGKPAEKGLIAQNLQTTGELVKLAHRNAVAQAFF